MSQGPSPRAPCSPRRAVPGQSTGGAGRQLAHGPNRAARARPAPPGGGATSQKCEGLGEARPSASVRASSQCVMINSPYQTLAVPPA